LVLIFVRFSVTIIVLTVHFSVVLRIYVSVPLFPPRPAPGMGSPDALFVCVTRKFDIIYIFILSLLLLLLLLLLLYCVLIFLIITVFYFIQLRLL